MRKIISSLLILISIFCLTSCGKNVDETTEEFKPNYAITDVKSPTEEDLEDVEDSESPNISFIDDTSNRDVYSDDYSEEDKSVVSNNITFTYPMETDNGFYINNIKVAETIPFGFILNDIAINITDGKDSIIEQSNTNKIFCQGYANSLKLVDTDILSTGRELNRLSIFAPAIEYIQLGSYQYELNELLYNTDNFEQMIKMFSTNYNIKPLVDVEGNILSYDENNIFSYAREDIGKNNGKSYIWTFTWLDENEYTSEDKNIILNKIGEIPNNTITIIADYDSTNTLVYYTFSIKKAAHFWVDEIVHIESEGEAILNEDGTISENIINQKEVHTGIYNCSQDGYYFTDGYIKTLDGSYIGLNTIEITIHNQNCKSNKNKSFDYFIK